MMNLTIYAMVALMHPCGRGIYLNTLFLLHARLVLVRGENNLIFR